MDIKVLAKIGLVVGGLIGIGVVSGVITYKNNRKFKKSVDKSLYPGMKQIVIDNGPTVIKATIAYSLSSIPVAKNIFLMVIDSIEKGNIKLPKSIVKQIFEIKDIIPTVQNLL